MRGFPCTVITLFLLPLLPLPAADFSSGPARTTLLELYTSEGCSSCPPAEAWMTRLANDPGLWKTFVPVAFHVDYWDHLGWKDRLASPDHAARQRSLAEAGTTARIYTPGFYVDGREWRGFFSGQALPRDASPAAGTLTLRVDEPTGDASVVFRPEGDLGGHPEACLVLLGSGILHRITSGENRGRNLEHDFTVLGWKKAPLRRQNDGTWRAEFPPLSPSLPGPLPRTALAAWIQADGSPVPLQATGGWLAH